MAEVKSERNEIIDILKGLGIIFMVAGHAAFPLTDFVYLFHMAIFFIASGYCYSSKKTNSGSNLFLYVKRKFKSLWVPYVLWTVIYTVLHNFLLKINVYTDNPLILEMVQGTYIHVESPWTLKGEAVNIIKSLFLHGQTEMGGAFWFIATLMEISLFYGIMDFIFQKIFSEKYLLIVQGIFAILLLMLGWGLALIGRSLWGADKVFSYYSLFYLGYLIKTFNLPNKLGDAYIKHAISLCGSVIVLVLCSLFGTVSLSANSYGNPFYLLIASLSGWQLTYELSWLIEKNKWTKQILTVIGRNTLSIVILHFLSFKLVSLVGVLITGKPICLIAAFPILFRGAFWWIPYTLVGVGVPVALNIVYKKSINQISLFVKRRG